MNSPSSCAFSASKFAVFAPDAAHFQRAAHHRVETDRGLGHVGQGLLHGPFARCRRLGGQGRRHTQQRGLQITMRQVVERQDALTGRRRAAGGAAGGQQAHFQLSQFLVGAKEGKAHTFLVVCTPHPGTFQVGGRSALGNACKLLHSLDNVDLSHVDSP